MTFNKKTATIVLAAGSLLAVQAPAFAGGLERGGYNIDLLFDPSSVAAEAATTFVMPQRKLKNVRDRVADDGDLNSFGYSSSADETENYWSPRIGVKAGMNDAACMFDYSQPFGAHVNYGPNWAGANQNIETEVNSDNYALTCSYSFDVGPGKLRVIGGGNYLEMDGFRERLVVAPETLAGFGLTGTGLGRLDLAGDGWGWRAGIAYEIPEYAVRASLMYYSEVKLKDITGTVDLTGVPALLGTFPTPTNPLVPGAGTVIPVTGSTAMPDSIELKVQSGIAPDWLAFGSVKWVDWSQLQNIPFYAANGREVTSLDLGYRDGWTITGGIGHKFNDQWSGAVSVTWDRGTSTGYMTQTDSWLFGAGVAYAPTEQVEIRLAGVLGILTGGSSGETSSPAGPIGGEATYDFGSDLVAAVSTSLKVKF